MNETTAGPASFQPVAPQAPGELLYGRFGGARNHMMQNWKMYLMAAAVVLLAWWLWKKYA